MTLLTGKSNKNSGQNKVQAFTLVEIMVSISILSLGLVLILQWFAYSLNVLRISQDYLTAALVFEDKMADAEIKFKEDKDKFKEDSNEMFESSGMQFEFNAQLGAVDYRKESDSGEEVEFEDLYNLKTNLSWREGKRKGRIPLDTYLVKYENKAQ
ncbi:MAG: prepilin-type N-terminal cleavage/methylation domain-containing protein [Candidatus Omnitrophica bacterium]|nr:prepilin-type N-terminal cleavage/methylation domain-containing protein [Candidatus Omnitrophota bacterium]